MLRRHRFTIAATGLALTIALMITFAPSASARSSEHTCPSGGTPAPGSTINKLEVDGFCQIQNVTVTGGIQVDPTPASASDANTLVVDASHIDGGVVVGTGSSFWVGANFFTIELTHNSSTINGGIRLIGSGPFDVVADATIRGGVSAEGPNLFGLWLCGSNLEGNLSLTSLATGAAFVGDPGEDTFANGDCAGNAIHGSIALTDSNFILPFNGESNEIEGNTVTGSVRVDHSTAETYGNTISGSFLCSNGAIIQPAPPGDPSGTTNAVDGANTCF